MNSKHICLLGIIFATVLISCSGDYLDDLGGGYTLARTNKYNHRITKGHVIYVDTNVTEYLTGERYIFGYRDKPAWSDMDEQLASKAYGFFIFDKETAFLEEGMDEKRFLLRANELGFSRDKVMRESLKKTD